MDLIPFPSTGCLAKKQLIVIEMNAIKRQISAEGRAVALQ